MASATHTGGRHLSQPGGVARGRFRPPFGCPSPEPVQRALCGRFGIGVVAGCQSVRRLQHYLSGCRFRRRLPLDGTGELFDGPQDCPEKVCEGRRHGPCLQLAPQELVLVELVHGHVRAGNQVALIAPMDDQVYPPADPRIEQRDFRGGLISLNCHLTFPRIFREYLKLWMYLYVGYKCSDYKHFPQTRRFTGIV